MYNPDANDPIAYQLYSDVLTEVIAIFYQNAIVRPEMHFKMKKGANQMWTFSVWNRDNALATITAGNIFIQLEFVKYREVKEQKLNRLNSAIIRYSISVFTCIWNCR